MPELPGTPDGLVSAETLTLISGVALIAGSMIRSFLQGFGERKKAKEAAAFESPPAQWPSPQAVFSFIEMGQSLDTIGKGVSEIRETQQNDRRRAAEHIQATEATQRGVARLEDDMERMSREVQSAQADIIDTLAAVKAMLGQVRDAIIVLKKEGGV